MGGDQMQSDVEVAKEIRKSGHTYGLRWSVFEEYPEIELDQGWGTPGITLTLLNDEGYWINLTESEAAGLASAFRQIADDPETAYPTAFVWGDDHEMVVPVAEAQGVIEFAEALEGAVQHAQEVLNK
jgi:hypothetical protein